MPEGKIICGRMRPNHNNVGGQPLICTEPIAYYSEGEPYKIDGLASCRGCFLMAVKDLSFDSVANLPTVGPVPTEMISP